MRDFSCLITHPEPGIRTVFLREPSLRVPPYPTFLGMASEIIRDRQEGIPIPGSHLGAHPLRQDKAVAVSRVSVPNGCESPSETRVCALTRHGGASTSHGPEHRGPPPIPGNTIPQNPVVLSRVAHRASERSRTIAPTIRCRTHGCPRPAFCNAAIVYPHCMRSAPSETPVFSNRAGSGLFLPRGALGARQPRANPRPFRENRSVFRAQTRRRPLAEKSHTPLTWPEEQSFWTCPECSRTPASGLPQDAV